MIRTITSNKFLSFGIFLTLFVIGLKWAVDVCLPIYYESRIFPPTWHAPDAVCEKVVAWDVWAREGLNERVQADDEFSPSADPTQSLVFTKDFVRLTVILSKVPNQIMPLIQIVFLVFLTSAFLAILIEGVSRIISTPVNLEGSGWEEQKRRLTATFKVMPTYTPEHDTERPPEEFPTKEEEE